MWWHKIPGPKHIPKRRLFLGGNLIHPYLLIPDNGCNFSIRQFQNISLSTSCLHTPGVGDRTGNVWDQSGWKFQTFWLNVYMFFCSVSTDFPFLPQDKLAKSPSRQENTSNNVKKHWKRTKISPSPNLAQLKKTLEIPLFWEKELERCWRPTGWDSSSFPIPGEEKGSKLQRSQIASFMSCGALLAHLPTTPTSAKERNLGTLPTFQESCKEMKRKKIK